MSQILSEDQFRAKQIDEACVFKGSFDVNLDSLVASSKEAKSGQSETLNKIHFCCELFLVGSSNFTMTESIGEWIGYTLLNEGYAHVPMYFDSFHCCAMNTEVAFYWTSLEVKDENRLLSQVKAKDLRIQEIHDILDSKYGHLIKNYSKRAKSMGVNIDEALQKNALKQSKKPKSGSVTIDNISEVFKTYNERTHHVWKSFQQLFLSQGGKTGRKNNLAEEEGGCEAKQDPYTISQLQKYYEKLNEYHLKNNVITTDTIEPAVHQQKQSIENFNNLTDSKAFDLGDEKKKEDPRALILKKQECSDIESNAINKHDLPVYPFESHEIQVKLSNQDFKKLAKVNQAEKKQPTIHLIIFVHGYQASNFDMQSICTYLKYRNPEKIITFVSSTNEGRTDQKIEELGHRLAIEIKSFINNKTDISQSECFEMSFVCHSMGGLITRASLKYLQLYRKRMRMFVSLCSPHLGYLCHSSALINTSLWVLNQIRKEPSMLELTMQDQPELEKTYLYELSKRREMDWFRHFVFLGSREDEYVPFWSALARDKDFFFSSKKSEVYKTLFNNFTHSIEDRIIRIEAIYKGRITDLSSFVGRTAHIKVLSSVEMFQFLNLLLSKIL